jgi:hypothetical protein
MDIILRHVLHMLSSKDFGQQECAPFMIYSGLRHIEIPALVIPEFFGGGNDGWQRAEAPSRRFLERGR